MRVAVIGTGYVGLVTGTCLAKAGHEVICVDTQPMRIAAVNNAKPAFYEPGLAEMLSETIRAGRMRAISDVAAAVAASEVTFLAVGTPLHDGEIDLSYLAAAADQVGSGLKRGNGYHVVVVKSTVIPGTTDSLVREAIERSSGMRVGTFGLCMNPEFLREGSAVADFMNPDRIVVGQWDERSGQVLAELYKSFDCPKIFTALRNAELTKYASNALLANLVSFSNEFAALCEATPGTDVETVLGAVHLDRRLSPVINGKRIELGILSYLRAGCGFGGSCLPKDVAALGAFGRKSGVETTMLDAAAKVNAERPAQLAATAEAVLGPLRGTAIALLGLTFKAGTDDLRDSPALALAELLEQRGAKVNAYDPMVSVLPDVYGFVNVCGSAKSALEKCDAAIVATAWPEFKNLDWNALCSAMRSPVVIDGRNALRDVALPANAVYIPIGRHFDRKGVAVGK